MSANQGKVKVESLAKWVSKSVLTKGGLGIKMYRSGDHQCKTVLILAFRQKYASQYTHSYKTHDTTNGSFHSTKS